MDLIDIFQRLGLAIAIGAAVGVERHWRERDEPEGARIAGIRTFTLIGMTGGLAGLLDAVLAPGSLSGLIVASFLISVSVVLLRFGLMEARAEGSFSATTVIAGITTFGLGALAVTGEMAVASAAGAAMVTVLASREFLHGAIRRLTWVELRSAVILLAMSFVLLPLIPADPYGPFGGVSPRSILILVIMLASISYAGYVAVRLIGGGRGDLVAGAVGGLVSSTATTLAMARQSELAANAAGPSAGAMAAGSVSLIRTGLLLFALAPTLAERLLPGLLVAGGLMLVGAIALVARAGPSSEADLPGNPFELSQVIKMALLITVIAFVARAASQILGDGGLYIVSGLTALADVDAMTVTVAGMLPGLPLDVATTAIGIAVTANMLAKVVYAAAAGSRGFALRLAAISLLAVVSGFVVTFAAGLV
ncbi:MAG: MgtC/SapB family protein [Rhizobium rhizophilum]|uniref:MgtC/SapB family protein n=1 Tax=Rhizobium rhizophilum TaxID=1850373 RepID=UPI00391D01AA